MCKKFCPILARDSSGIHSFLGDKVKTASALDTLFIERAFIRDVIMSIRCNRSVENKLESFNRVSNDLNTLMDASS